MERRRQRNGWTISKPISAALVRPSEALTLANRVASLINQIGGIMPNSRMIAVFAALVGSIVPTFAQSWPTRPVTMVVTFAAGSGDDVLGRIVAARLSEALGQQVIVENVGGAGGMNGVSRVAKATPDG